MRLAILIFVLTTASSTLLAQELSPSDFGLPENFAGLDLNPYGLGVIGKEDKYYIYDDADVRTYWPKQLHYDRQGNITHNPRCSGNSVTVLIKDLPTEKYDIDRLWNKVSPSIKRFMIDNCRLDHEHPSEPKSQYTTLYAKIYFDALSLSQWGEIQIGPLKYHDSRTPLVAIGKFVFHRDTLAEGQVIEGRRVENFGPPERVRFTADNFFTNMYGMDSGFRSEGFPSFSFLDAVAYTTANWDLYEKRRQAESDAFWRAFASGLVIGLERIQCDSAKIEGRSIPWWCEKYFPGEYD